MVRRAGRDKRVRPCRVRPGLRLCSPSRPEDAAEAKAKAEKAAAEAKANTEKAAAEAKAKAEKAAADAKAAAEKAAAEKAAAESAFEPAAQLEGLKAGLFQLLYQWGLRSDAPAAGSAPPERRASRSQLEC